MPLGKNLYFGAYIDKFLIQPQYIVVEESGCAVGSPEKPVGRGLLKNGRYGADNMLCGIPYIVRSFVRRISYTVLSAWNERPFDKGISVRLKIVIGQMVCVHQILV